MVLSGEVTVAVFLPSLALNKTSKLYYSYLFFSVSQALLSLF